MSIWYDIENKEDIDLSEDKADVHILYKSDNMGNYYVSIPAKFLRELLGVASPVHNQVSLSECSPQGCAHERQENAGGEILRQALRYMFYKGQDWAECYQGWFVPDDKQTRERLDEAFEDIKEKLGVG